MDDKTLFEILEHYDPQCAEFYHERGYLIGCDVKNYAASLMKKCNCKKDRLPDEFDFITHINAGTEGMIYHAQRSNMWHDDFYVTLDGQDGGWVYDGQELQEHIDCLDFEVVVVASNEDE